MAQNTSKNRTRTPNVQPNLYPAHVLLSVLMGSKVLGTIEIPQTDNLSEAGNVLFSGGVRKGLVLGDTSKDEPVDIMGSVSFKVNDVQLGVAASGVHRSEKGNPTVCHTGYLEFPTPDGVESFRDEYTVRVQLTHLGDDAKGNDRHFNLSVRLFPKATATGGPQVIGELLGLTVV